MTTIMPEGENLRKAIKWIADMRLDGGGTSDRDLINQASMKFNLTPLEADFLVRCQKENNCEDPEK